jgi:Ca2+-binding EF-hand superfamily protein
MNKKVSYGQILRLMRHYDTNEDGHIDFSEYKKMVAAL